MLLEDYRGRFWALRRAQSVSFGMFSAFSCPQSSGVAAVVQEIAAALEEHRARVGVVHLGLHGDETGLVTSWRQQLEAIAEPSEGHPPSY